MMGEEYKSIVDIIDNAKPYWRPGDPAPTADDLERTYNNWEDRSRRATRPRVPSPGQATKAPITFTLFRDIEAEPRKKWLIDDMLGDGELSIWFGAPGCGKSVIIGDAACHVSAGLEWFDRPVQRCAVLYIAAERGALVKRRFAAFRKHHGIDELPLAVTTGMFDLCTNEIDAERVIEATKALEEATGLPVGWIIIDTKAQTMGGGDENSAPDMMRFVQNCARIQQGTLAHITVIDHVPHYDPSRMRGHGSLLGAADTTFKVAKEGGLRIASIEKVNDGPDDVSVAFTLDSVTLSIDPETGKATTAPVVVPATLPDIDRTSKNVRLTNSEEIAMRQLNEALAEQGEKPPSDPNIPRGVTVVRVDVWRSRCYRGQISDSDKADARQKAFKRAADALQRKAFIGIWGEWVWSV